MKWVLIYWFISNGIATTTGSAIFDDNEACRAAVFEMQESYRAGSPEARGICMPSAMKK